MFVVSCILQPKQCNATRRDADINRQIDRHKSHQKHGIIRGYDTHALMLGNSRASVNAVESRPVQPIKFSSASRLMRRGKFIPPRNPTCGLPFASRRSVAEQGGVVGENVVLCGTDSMYCCVCQFAVRERYWSSHGGKKTNTHCAHETGQGFQLEDT